MVMAHARMWGYFPLSWRFVIVWADRVVRGPPARASTLKKFYYIICDYLPNKLA